MILVPNNTASAWDHQIQGHLQRMVVNQSLRTVQPDSDEPGGDSCHPPLHPPSDGDRHSPLANRSNNDSLLKRPINNSMPFPDPEPSEDHEGMIHATGHRMGLDSRICTIPSDT